ncbi:MAG: hypothetical protein K9G42_02765 [Pedobacter sp.]|nr:hypothetical protein [Pedobacter sp.]
MFKNIKEITLPLSATFKSTFPDQQNPNGLIPDNSFIHKGFKTAFGLTYSEFKAKRHSIIVLSQQPIIDSKMIEHADTMPHAVFGDLTAKTFTEIQDYLANDAIQYKKLVVTPESFWKIIEAAKAIGKLQWLYDYFFCFLDECHCYAADKFRAKDGSSILTPFDYFWNFKRKALGSATPYPFSDPRFKKLTYYKLKFEKKFGKVSIVHHIDPRTVLDYYLRNPHLFPGKVFIWFNSVTEMGQAVVDSGVDDVLLFCSKTEENMTKLGAARKHFKDQAEGTEYKKFNIFTCRYFEGWDLRDDQSATMILITDQNVKHTVVGINYRGVQAVGRLRLKPEQKPHQIIHITNTKYVDTIERSRIEEDTIYSANNHIDYYNRFSSQRISDGMTDRLKLTEFVEDYADIKFNRAKINYHKVDQIVYPQILPSQYSSLQNIVDTWSECNYDTEVVQIGVEKSQGVRRKKEDTNREIIERIEAYSNEVSSFVKINAQIEIERLRKENGPLMMAYHILGATKLKELNYNNKKMEAALNERHNKNMEAKVRIMLSERVEIREYTKKEIKSILQGIYDELDIRKPNGSRKIANAEELNHYGMFEIELFKGKNAKGTRTEMIRISGFKFGIKRVA